MYRSVQNEGEHTYLNKRSLVNYVSLLVGILSSRFIFYFYVTGLMPDSIKSEMMHRQSGKGEGTICTLYEDCIVKEKLFKTQLATSKIRNKYAQMMRYFVKILCGI